MEKPEHTFWATQYYFSHLLSLFSFTSGIPVTQISFVVVPHIPEDPFIYFTFCFISVVKIGSFLLSPSLLILPSVPTILLWVHMLSFFIWLLYFSVLKFLVGSLCLLFLCWALLFLFLRLSIFSITFVHSCSLKPFHHGRFKVFVRWFWQLSTWPPLTQQGVGVLEYGGLLSWGDGLESSLTFHDASAECALVTAWWGGSLGFPFSLRGHEWGWGHGFLHSG